MILVLIILFASSINTTDTDHAFENIIENDQCDLMLRYVSDWGVGIYAGQLFKPSSVLETNIAIPIADSIRLESVLDLYVESYNESHASLTLGYSLVYNHAPIKDGRMVSKKKDYDKYYHFKYMNESSNYCDYFTHWTIFPGDQIFSYYGEGWFEQRGYEEASTRHTLNTDVLRVENAHTKFGRIPGCTTKYTIFDNDSKQLYSAIDIPRGTIVEIARVLLIPVSPALLFEGKLLNEFLWWKPPLVHFNESVEPAPTWETGTHSSPYDKKINHAVVLLGRGMLYGSSNDSLSGMIKVPNIKYDWWDISMIGIESTEFPDIFDYCEEDENEDGGDNETDDSEDNDEDKNGICEERRMTKNNFLCSSQMFVSFTATRDIMEGEQLIIDLKTDLATGFRYTNTAFGDECL
eukprot:gene5181-7209_t